MLQGARSSAGLQTTTASARAREMATRGREKVCADYTLSAVTSSVKRLYEDLIEEKQCVT